MCKQRGMALPGLIFWGIFIALAFTLGIKVAPEYFDYYKIKKSAKAVSTESNGKTLFEIRTAFDKHLAINHINTIKGSDLDISKEGNEIIISFDYERRIPLFHNISLLIDFQGSSSEH